MVKDINGVLKNFGNKIQEDVKEYLLNVKGFSEEQIKLMKKNRYSTLKSDYNNRKNDIDFYTNTLGYLIDLSEWNCSNMYQNKLKPYLDFLLNSNIKTCIDYGGGLGFLSIVLSELGINVIYVDVLGETFSFAEWYFKKYNKQIVCLSHKDFLKSQIITDCIISFDVLEHIENPIAIIEQWIKKAPILIFDAVWSKDNGQQPMHYEYHINLPLLMLGYGFIHTFPNVYIQNKGKRDIAQFLAGYIINLIE